jgi:hypothetical protein
MKISQVKSVQEDDPAVGDKSTRGDNFFRWRR